MFTMQMEIGCPENEIYYESGESLISQNQSVSQQQNIQDVIVEVEPTTIKGQLLKPSKRENRYKNGNKHDVSFEKVSSRQNEFGLIPMQRITDSDSSDLSIDFADIINRHSLEKVNKK